MRKLSVQQKPTRKLLGAIVAAALFLPGAGYTLGLGEIEVNSGLNQRLNADIKLLSATAEETQALIVQLASQEEFSRVGLDRPFILNDLIFKHTEINGSHYIRVSSSRPIREPFLNFLVKIDWPNGRLLREYTVLLDPPVFMTQPASAAVNNVAPAQNNFAFRPASGIDNNAVPVVTPEVSVFTRPASTAQLVTAPIQAPQRDAIHQPAGNYRVKAGDTAWSLAYAMRPDQSISVERMMVALLRENRESFINENINGLKRGHILRVPDYDQITSLSHADAIALVREQAALWRQHQQVARVQPVSQMPVSDAGVAAEDRVTGHGMVGEDDAYLEIVSVGPGDSTTIGKDPVEMTSQELRAELALARERIETERVEKEALQERVDSLQQNVEKMRDMLTIEDAELAAVQSLNMLEGEAAESVIDEPVMEDTNAVDEATPFVDETRVDEAMVDEALAEDKNMAERVASTNDFVADQPQTIHHEPADPLTQPLSNPMLLVAAGGGLLLFLALTGLIIKRRKAEKAAVPVTTMNGFDNLEVLADELASEDNASEKLERKSAVDEKLVDDTDSAPTMAQHSAEEPATVQAEGSTEAGEEESRDDVIAEADVYLAYGIYQQAEELLTQAIADNPERDDYRLKLAETYYASKNTDEFVAIASDIKQRVDNDASPIWKKVLGMGQDLCADNPLFKSAMVGGLVTGSLSAGVSETDFDLDMDGTTDAMPEENHNLDSDLHEEPLELPELETDAEASDPADEVTFDLNDVGAVEEPVDMEEEFSLDIDVSELDIEVKDEVEAAGEGIDLTNDIEESFDLTELDLTDLDIVPDEETVDDNAVVDEAAVETSIVEDVDDIDIDFDMDKHADLEKKTVDEDIAIDLTEDVDLLDIDLNENLDVEVVEETAAVSSAEAVSVTSDDFADEEDFDLSKLDDVDEINTKLDLARAYHDMGDHEGAKSILEEVLVDGDDEQKREASKLMEKLG